jgi:hypothetical protein
MAQSPPPVRETNRRAARWFLFMDLLKQQEVIRYGSTKAILATTGS